MRILPANTWALTFRQKGRIILQKNVLLNSPAALHKGMSMTIKEKMHGAVAVLSLKGNLMGEPDTENLRDKIYSLLQEGLNKIVVDMKGVRWISSTGLGTLIAALTSVRNKSGDLRLANITEKVESLFAITQLVKVFKTYETVDRAIASYK
jgi:anti-sigma B factor antagonist